MISDILAEKIFKNKLLLGFLAVVFVIKLIKIKLLWLLPFLIGYGAAKKLVLKVLLFFFPALAHIFKLCSWYHHNYHHGSTKLHHHNHHISHTHTVRRNMVKSYLSADNTLLDMQPKSHTTDPHPQNNLPLLSSSCSFVGL